MSIHVEENFFDELLLQQCITYSDEQYQGKQFHLLNQRDWGKNIVQDSGNVHIHIMPSSELYQNISETIFKKTGYTPSSIMCYYWAVNSHICWHNDGDRKGAITVYLNQTWDANHGGLFMYQTPENEIKALVPTRNRAIIQLGGVMHAVSCTTNRSQLRKTLQIFIK